MLKKYKTQKVTKRRRNPDVGAQRPLSLTATLALAAVCLALAPLAKVALGAERSLEPDSPRYGVRTLATLGETTRNGQCYQKTFLAPTDKDADLVGTFIMRLLSDELRAQTTWRFDKNSGAITIYGPAKAIEISEKFINDFSEPLYEAFINSGEFASFVGVAPSAQPLQTNENAPVRSRSYYDPDMNDVVRVAYEPEGAIVPDRTNYAPAFGGGELPQPVDAQPTVQERPSLLTAVQNSAVAQHPNAQLNNDDLLLDVVAYRCPPSLCDRVAQLVQRQFATNPEVAFSVDATLGSIVVHTNRKMQREVAAFLEKLNVLPTKQSASEPDLRVASGTVTPIEGERESERGDAPANLLGVKDQTQSETSITLDPDAAARASISDVYAPQFRKVDELHDALLQLFGQRLERLPSDPEAPFSERQIATYRYIKRNPAAKEAEQQQEYVADVRACDLAIDSLHNQIALQGDPGMCAQMLVLLRAMDQPPLRNGNVRRFIPIRNADSKRIRQIFEYDSQKNANTPKRPVSLNDVYRLADEVAIAKALRKLGDDESPRERAVGYVSELIAPERRAALAKIANQPKVVRPLDDAFNAVDSICGRQRPGDGIRQVAYQEGDFGDVGGFAAPAGSSDFDGLRGGRVGVVQDFTPIVLDNIDVVIVDNATDAEFQRIQQMINQIEELAKIAEITTEIYNLKHVDCAMLHGVLTTLYAEMFTTKQGRVVFYALQNPNALLVAGWGQAYEDMKRLIEMFDQPIQDGAGMFRVARLKYASADEIATLLTQTFATPLTAGASGFAPRIRVFPDVRTNSLLIQASPNDWQEVQKILLELDVNKADTKLVTKVIPLKNSLAENTRTTIMNIILSAKQGTLDTTAAKFPILQLLSVDETGKRLVESGVMMDVDVVADVFHNQLVVTAPEDCIEFMEKLVELLDVAPKKAQIRFFQVRNGDATQIVQTLQSLLATADDNLSTPTLPQADGEETFVPVRFAVDSRTNVIIAAAAPKELSIVDALIVALDGADKAERKVEVVQLRNIQALVVAEAIDDYLSQKQQLETASEVLSTFQLYESQVIVIPESISNSIIVSASGEEMEKILDMIKIFDADPPQVQIQVLIAEVTLSDQEQFGIEAGLQNSTSFDRSMITTTSSGSSTGVPGFDIIGSNGPGKNMSAPVNSRDIAGQVLNNFAMGTTDSTLGYGGFVVSASSRSVQLTLRALREKNRLQVLSRPQVTAMDNQQAFILVGQRVPRINGTTTTNYGVQMNTTDTPVGLILLVTPRVTKDNRVVMEIGAEKSSLGNDSDATPIYSQNGEVIKSRSIDTIQTMTAISARDGETVMLGGLLRSNKEKISRGVPFVSDLPIVGRLFRYDQEVEQRRELLIVMTPHIMRDSCDFSEVMRVEMSKMHVDLDEAMSINGNMGLYDPRTSQGYQTKKTKRIMSEILHPDKMDELDNIPPYSPQRDYAPRYNTTSPESAPSRATSPSLRSAPSPRRVNTVEPSQPTRQGPAIPRQNSILNDEFYLDGATDDFSANERTRATHNEPDVPQRAEERVAMRVDPEPNEPGALNAPNNNETTRSSTPHYARLLNEAEEANAATSPARADNLRETSADEPATRRPVGISNYRNRNVTRRASELNREEEEEYREDERGANAVRDSRGETYIRGQVDDTRFDNAWTRPFYWLDLAKATRAQENDEQSNAKIFRWSILGL